MKGKKPKRPMSPPKPIMKMQTQSKPRLVTGVAEKEQKDDYSTLIIGLILLIMIPGTSFCVFSQKYK